MTDRKIHYWELSNYVGGKLIGRWFDLDGVTYDEHLKEITDWLEELSEETGELCEEWIVGDTEGVPHRYVGEYSIDKEFFEYLEIMERSDIPEEAFEIGISAGVSIDRIEDAYRGQYDSESDIVWEYMDNGGLGDIPESVKGYIDEDAVWRDLSVDLYYEDGYLFDMTV